MSEANKIYLLRGNDTPLSVCLRKREGDGDPVPYDLSEAERIRLALVGHGMRVFAKDIEVSGDDDNVVSGMIPGRSLLKGGYDLEVTFTLDGRDKRFAIDNLFEAVDFLAEDADGEAEGEGAGIFVTVTVQPEVIDIVGPPGPQGKSAYEVAVDEGYVGTETEWLASLKGETGATGPQGPEGPEGATGATGATGKSAYQSWLDQGNIGTEAEFVESLKANVKANEEDIDFDSADKLQFADRVYNTSTPDGLGYVILRKNKTFAEQVTKENTIYEIRYDFDLGGDSLDLPANCVLRFNGGCLRNGILNGNNASINEDVTYQVFDNVTPKNFEFTCFDIRWIGAIPGDIALDSAPYFQKAMDLCEFYQSLPIRVIGKYKIATTVVCRNHFQLFGCNFTTRAFITALPEHNNSVIYVPANVTAFHVSGIQLTAMSYCSFNVHNLRFEGSDRNTSVLFKVTTSGAPSRPCVFTQCESYGFNKVFHIAIDENNSGTMVSQWVIRENSIAGNTSFISTDQTEKLTLMNLDIIDNVLEQHFGKAIVIYNPAGYINFENNIIESNADFTISIPQTSKQCHLNVCGNYLEGAKPFLSIMADFIASASGAVTLRCHDNYFYQGASINKYQVVLQNVIVDDIDSGRYISDDSSFVGCYFSKSANIAELSISCLGEFNGFEELPEFECGEFFTTSFKNTGLALHNVVNGRIVNRKDSFGTTQLSTYGFSPVADTVEGDIAIALLYCGLSGSMSINFSYGISSNKNYGFPRPGFALVKRAYPASGRNIAVSAYISTQNQYSYYSACVTIVQLRSHPEVTKVGNLSVGKNVLEDTSVPLPSNENAGLVATIANSKKVMWTGNAWKNLDGSALT